MKVKQSSLVKEFYLNNPNREVPHAEAVDWLTVEYAKRNNGEVFRDPDRTIRKLSQEGFLIKIRKGVYKYDPLFTKQRILKDFTQAQKDFIKKRDGYRCVVCGKTEREGIELHVDHIKPKDLGGLATIDNGQTLCAKHNFQKKNFKQTETGKKMFIRLYKLAQNEQDTATEYFCRDILEIFEKHGVNGHIQWER